MPEYRLLVEHKINGVKYPIGHVAAMSQQLGEWWVEQRIAERVNGNEVARVATPAVVSKPVYQQSTSPRWSCCGKRAA